MRSTMAVRALVVSWVLAVILAGCGGSNGNQVSGSPTPVPGSTPSPTPSPTPTPTATPTPTPSQFTPSRFIYTIVDFEADGGFFGGAINSANGKVSPVPGTPTANALGQNIVIQVISDPQGRFLYSLNLGASSFGIQFGQIGIGGYKIDRSTGALTPIPNPIIFPAVRDQLMAIDGTGRFLYQPNTNGFDAYTIDQNSGVLTLMPEPASGVPVGTNSAATRDGRFLVNEGNGLMELLAINSSNGQITPAAPPVALGGSGGPLTVSADSSTIYVGNTTEGTVSVFSIGPTGALTPVAGSPFPVDTNAAGLSLTPDGRFLYIAFGSPDVGHVKGWAVNPAAGTFTHINGADLSNAQTIDVDGSGAFAYVSQAQLVTYKIDPVTGALTAVAQTSQPFTDLPQNVALTH